MRKRKRKNNKGGRERREGKERGREGRRWDQDPEVSNWPQRHTAHRKPAGKYRQLLSLSAVPGRSGSSEFFQEQKGKTKQNPNTHHGPHCS